jgi:voltage-gated potassium channel
MSQESSPQGSSPRKSDHPRAPETPWRHWLHEIIFEADTPAGKAFDVALLVTICASIVAVALDSVAGVRRAYGSELRAFEWLVTILFTVEYVLRLVTVRRPWRYARSFYGVVDLLALLPTYVSLLVVGSHSLIVIRALRLLRVFRVLKLATFVGEASLLMAAIRGSSRKIIVFLTTVLTLVVIVGALMYVVEGERHGFTSIPQSVYWAIVTMTTVGYGDLSPQTVLGKTIASMVMILGYGIIAVPTGIVTAELSSVYSKRTSSRSCRECGSEGHANDADYCRHCGAQLRAEQSP